MSYKHEQAREYRIDMPEQIPQIISVFTNTKTKIKAIISKGGIYHKERGYTKQDLEDFGRDGYSITITERAGREHKMAVAGIPLYIRAMNGNYDYGVMARAAFASNNEKMLNEKIVETELKLRKYLSSKNITIVQACDVICREKCDLNMFAAFSKPGRMVLADDLIQSSSDPENSTAAV